MTRRNYIIVFGNQKGGVGKSTLCTMFANYLSEQNEKVRIIDCDKQHSVTIKREKDLKAEPEATVPYPIQRMELTTIEKSLSLMQAIKKYEGFVLLDSPGNLYMASLIPLVCYCDMIICPYQYEATTLWSTISYLNFIGTSWKKENVPHRKLVYVPNRVDVRVGLQDEKKQWRLTDDAFEKTGGVVTPKIHELANIGRYTTLGNYPEQKKSVEPAFDTIMNIING